VFASSSLQEHISEGMPEELLSKVLINLPAQDVCAFSLTSTKVYVLFLKNQILPPEDNESY
jgi:hypothetical protein